MKLYCECGHAGKGMYSRFNTVVCLNCGAMYDADIASARSEKFQQAEKMNELGEQLELFEDGEEV